MLWTRGARAGLATTAALCFQHSKASSISCLSLRSLTAESRAKKTSVSTFLPGTPRSAYLPPAMADLLSLDPLQSEFRMTYNSMKNHRHTKWGFVFYRTSYTSEALWAHFQSFIVESGRASCLRSDTPELVEYLDDKFVSEPSRLENADIPTVQRIHAKWRLSPEARAEQPQEGEPIWPSDIPRYKYCVYVDEEVMRSVADGPQPPERDTQGKTWVKFLHCNWQIEETREESWMMLATKLVHAAAYDYFHDDGSVNWYVFYKEPPAVVKH